MTKIMTVRSKEEFKKAVKNKEITDIIVQGDLAGKVHAFMKLKKYSPWTLALLFASIAAIPLTAGLSAPIAVGTTTITLDGIGIAAIILASTFSIAALKLIIFGFKPISFKKKDDGDDELHLERI